MPGSLTSGFLWSRRRGKSSRHSQHIHNPQIYVSGKRPIGWIKWHTRSREISRQLETLWRRMSAMSSHLKANCTQKIVQADEKNTSTWPVVCPHKGRFIRKACLCHDVIMCWEFLSNLFGPTHRIPCTQQRPVHELRCEETQEPGSSFGRW